MHFLIDANMPRSTAVRIRQLHHEATDVRDIGMGSADDGMIAAHAQAREWAILTRDFGFGDVRNYPPQDYYGIVVLNLPSDTSVQTVLGVVENLLRQTTVIETIPGSLLIVEFGRVRIRRAQGPGRG